LHDNNVTDYLLQRIKDLEEKNTDLEEEVDNLRGQLSPHVSCYPKGLYTYKVSVKDRDFFYKEFKNDVAFLEKIVSANPGDVVCIVNSYKTAGGNAVIKREETLYPFVIDIHLLHETRTFLIEDITSDYFAFTDLTDTPKMGRWCLSTEENRKKVNQEAGEHIIKLAQGVLDEIDKGAFCDSK
jgi:hypothetical protein